MLIQLKDVQKHYDRFDLNCSLQVEEGCITGLIGQNGAGKTTTFKAMLGLISIDEGDARVLGKRPDELTGREKQDIGVVLSNSGFNDYFMIKDVVKIMGQFYERFHKEEFIERCQKFHLPMDKKLKDFSTGMKAKLKVLTAISYGAKLLILDEPTAGLDVVARDAVLSLLREYMETEGRGILISSHISTDLEGICDDVYMIHKGEVVLHEETDVLLSCYGLLKVDEKQFQNLDKRYILKSRKEYFGYSCLTDQRQFYEENYPDIVIERGNIDEVITLTIKGDAL